MKVKYHILKNDLTITIAEGNVFMTNDEDPEWMVCIVDNVQVHITEKTARKLFGKLDEVDIKEDIMNQKGELN